MKPVQDLRTDLQSGEVLAQLIEIIGEVENVASSYYVLSEYIRFFVPMYQLEVARKKEELCDTSEFKSENEVIIMGQG